MRREQQINPNFESSRYGDNAACTRAGKGARFPWPAGITTPTTAVVTLIQLVLVASALHGCTLLSWCWAQRAAAGGGWWWQGRATWLLQTQAICKVTLISLSYLRSSLVSSPRRTLSSGLRLSSMPSHS